jgi:hypothetical protein
MINTADLKPMSAADVLKRYKNPAATMPTRTLVDIEKEIAKLELEAAYALAVETFLDCDYKKVKVSKRVPIVPKYARGVCK